MYTALYNESKSKRLVILHIRLCRSIKDTRCNRNNKLKAQRNSCVQHNYKSSFITTQLREVDSEGKFNIYSK